MTHTEGELHFDFSAAQTVIKLDDPSQPRPQGWKLVDFVIEEADRLVLLEVKESLRARLHQECAEPWSRPYVTDCLVLTETSWPKAFPRYTLRRGPDSAGDEKENEAD